MKKKIVIIGSGLGGLAAGCRLAAKGFDIEVFESRDKPGGLAFNYQVNGFRFEEGAVIITAPFLFEDFFKECGIDLEEHIQFTRLEPCFRFIHWDGSSLDIGTDQKTTEEEISGGWPDDLEGFRKFAQCNREIFYKGKRMNWVEPKNFTIHDAIKPRKLVIGWHPNNGKQYAAKFFRNIFLKKVFTFHPFPGQGFSGVRTKSLASVWHSINEWGGWHATGGTGALIDLLSKLLVNLGGRIHFNTTMNEIVTTGRYASGMRLEDGSIHRADYVISNADPETTVLKMLVPKNQRPQSRFLKGSDNNKKMMLAIHFGTRRRYRDALLAHHNIFFLGEGAGVFPWKIPAGGMTMMLSVPTFSDESMAPEGCETFRLVAEVPAMLDDGEWKEAARPIRDHLLGYLEEKYLPDLRANIIAEDMVTPEIYSARNRTDAIPANGNGVNFINELKVHLKRRFYKNLFLVGSQSSRGSGLLEALESARRISDELINQAGQPNGKIEKRQREDQWKER